MAIKEHYFDPLEQLIDEQIDQAYQARKAKRKRREWFSAGNAGFCKRATILNRLNAKEVDHSVESKRVFWIGDQIHGAIQRLVADSGKLVAMEQFVSSGWGPDAQDRVGVLDLILRTDDFENILYELKSKRTGPFWSTIVKGKKPAEQHVYQAITYWILNKKYRVDRVRIAYFSKEDAAMRSFEIEVTDELVARVEAWWNDVRAHWTRFELPAAYTQDTEEFKTFYCGTCTFSQHYCHGPEATVKQNLVELQWESPDIKETNKKEENIPGNTGLPIQKKSRKTKKQQSKD